MSVISPNFKPRWLIVKIEGEPPYERVKYRCPCCGDVTWLKTDHCPTCHHYLREAEENV